MLTLPERAPEWQQRALCAQIGGDFWFPERGESPREAKAVCNCCEVEADCLEYALDRGEEWGVWGGLTADEREELRPQPERVPPDVERVRRLVADRLTDRRIGEVVGMDRRAVQKLRERHGIPAGQPQPGRGRLVDRVRAVPA